MYFLSLKEIPFIFYWIVIFNIFLYTKQTLVTNNATNVPLHPTGSSNNVSNLYKDDLQYMHRIVKKEDNVREGDKY